MKKLLVLIAVLGVTATAMGAYRNGTYRGSYTSGGEHQVEVEFKLKNDIVTDAKYRTLAYKKTDYLKDDKVVALKNQYDALLKYADGKNVETVLEDLYSPGKIEQAGATIRASKVRAAMKDALNIGPYTPEKK